MGSRFYLINMWHAFLSPMWISKIGPINRSLGAPNIHITMIKLICVIALLSFILLMEFKEPKLQHSGRISPNNLSKFFPIGRETILYPSAESRAQWTKTVASQMVRVAQGIDYTAQIAIYLEGRERGLTQEEIGRDVFHADVELHSHGNGSSCCPHSYPFVTGDTFRAFADVVYDDTHSTLDKSILDHILLRGKRPDFFGGKELTKDGEVIFIKTDFTRDFVMGPLRSVKTKFIVVTHNSAYSVPRHVQDQELLKHPLLIRWFAQNLSPGYSDHEKMEAVPLGLENPRVRGYLISDIEPYLRAAPPAYSVLQQHDHRPNFLFVALNPLTNPLRSQALVNFKDIMDTPNRKLRRSEYFVSMMNSKFTLSPPGRGEDCHRTWEAILLSSIPIVRPSGIAKLFLNAPVFVLKNWNIDFNGSRAMFLNFSPDSMSKKYAMAQFWFDRINKYRN